MSSTRCTVAVGFALLALASSLGTPAAQSASTRIVAVGDVHGAADALVGILQAASLIDAQRRWIGGRTRLVQTGDFLDRGAAVRDVMDLLMRLEGEAKRAGGRVDVLFGNHEGMNVLYELRDVSPDAYATFTDDKSESKRARGFMTHATLAQRAGQVLNRNDWMREHPAGYIEYLESMQPSGRYGRWLRSRKAVLKIGDTIFMHAGIAPESTESIDDVNRQVERDINTLDVARSMLEREGKIAPFFSVRETIAAGAEEVNRIAGASRGSELPPDVSPEYVAALRNLMSMEKSVLVAPEGPLWYRGYATLPDDAQPQIEALLTRLGAARIVVGHTVKEPGQIVPRFGNRVFLIDAGMLATHFKGGRAAALEIDGRRITAIYPDERKILQASSGKDEAAHAAAAQ